ncbi:MAG: protein translocase subunit SecDF [Paludibacteraceae bacterium]|nr:protein translocase subunit SecDF [Paludibacteraceae bacterium]
MQNKGFVKLIAVLFAFACLFYLSFSLVTSHYESKAAKMYGEGTEEYNGYLDSLAGQKVWLGYTLKECRENELNLGLDLKGGMNVVMEVSVADIIKSLAGSQANTEEFDKAMKLAKEKQLNTQKDFVDLFAEAYKEANPGKPLFYLFSYEFKDKFTSTPEDREVVAALKEQVKAAVDNSFNVLRSRIDRFGVVQPNIQQLDIAGRILIEMPGVKEPERVRKLLQGTADLEFWETFDYNEVYGYLVAVNNMAREMEAASSKKAEDEQGNASDSDAKDTVAMSIADSLIAAAKASVPDSLPVNSDDANIKEFKKQNPFFGILEQRNVPNGRGPVIGVADVKDTSKVMNYFRLAREKRLIPASLRPVWTVKPVDEGGNKVMLIAINCARRDGKAPLNGSVITDARADIGQFGSSAEVSMEMNQEGAKKWAELTKKNINKSVAIVLDGYAYSYPNVNCEITGGRSQITGNFTMEEAKDLANVLKSGKMPAPAHIVQEDVVGPSLGQEAINAGLISFIVAFILVLIYMIFYYGLVPGLVADFALLCNVFFIFSVLASFKAVLTLPGIAGIVLTLGMAVDANVLIYERIREEKRNGSPIKKALTDGYGNALSAIIDSNITTVLTGIILFVFGTGPIKGFATTLIIGVLCSLFTAVFISRLIFDFLSRKKPEMMEALPFCTSATKDFLQNVSFDFIGKSKSFLLGSIVILVVGLASLFTSGLKSGIDFSGGRNYIVRFEQPINTADMASQLRNVFDNVSVITIGESNKVRISTNYKIMETSDNIDDEIESMVYDGVKSYLADGVTKDMFLSRYVRTADGGFAADTEDGSVTYGLQSSQKVGPTMADDIKTSAIFAVLIAVLVIGLYILIRFRDIAFSVGAVAALVHDTLFIMGIFSLLKNVMPFSMEVDQSFIAAILTVIGYSINDKVVIFDRIREFRRNFATRESHKLFNDALNSTLSRTFSTSMSTLVVLLIIFLFGGDTIRGFIFAMLVGVIVGTYSSWFIAAPIAQRLLSRKEDKASVNGNKGGKKEKEESSSAEVATAE